MSKAVMLPKQKWDNTIQWRILGIHCRSAAFISYSSKKTPNTHKHHMHRSPYTMQQPFWIIWSMDTKWEHSGEHTNQWKYQRSLVKTINLKERRHFHFPPLRFRSHKTNSILHIGLGQWKIKNQIVQQNENKRIYTNDGGISYPIHSHWMQLLRIWPSFNGQYYTKTENIKNANNLQGQW